MQKGRLTSGADFLACCSDTNYYALPPSLVACFECCSHDTHIARRVEGVVASAVRHLHQLFLDALPSQLRGVDKVRRAELLPPCLLPIIHIHDDDLRRAILHGALDNRQANASGAENSNGGVLLDVGGHDGRSITRCDATTKQACAIHRRFRCYCNDGDVCDDGILREGGSAHEM